MKPTEQRNSWERRRFLQTTAAAGLAALPVASAVARESGGRGRARQPNAVGSGGGTADPLGVRGSFPVADELAYLNNAAVGPLSAPVRDALHR